MPITVGDPTPGDKNSCAHGPFTRILDLHPLCLVLVSHGSRRSSLATAHDYLLVDDWLLSSPTRLARGLMTSILYKRSPIGTAGYEHIDVQSYQKVYACGVSKDERAM